MVARSKVATLPQSLRAWLDKNLIEGAYSGYEALAAELAERGYQISKSSLHRYGSKLEERLSALKIATDQARAVVNASPDDEGALNEALMRLVQERLFSILLEMDVDPKRLNISSLTKSVAELARASVTQKKWQTEFRGKIQAKLDALEAQASDGGGKGTLDMVTLKRIREEVYGIFN